MSGKKYLVDDKADFDRAFNEAMIIRLSFIDDGAPYIVPLCFGRDGNTLYFHTGMQGKKLDLLRRNPAVGFELDTGVGLKTGGDSACSYTMTFLSVIGKGRAYIVEDPEERMKAMDIVTGKYMEAKSGFQYKPESLARTVLFRVDIEEMTCKKNGV